MTLDNFLLWIVNSGGGAAVVSYVLEKLTWYQNQKPENKQYIFFGFTILITILGYLGITYIPAEYIKMATPYFAMVYTSFTALFLGTKFHTETKVSPVVTTQDVSEVKQIEKVKNPTDQGVG